MICLIDSMLNLDPSERPTIDAILSFKPVKKVVAEIYADPDLQPYYE